MCNHYLEGPIRSLRYIFKCANEEYRRAPNPKVLKLRRHDIRKPRAIRSSKPFLPVLVGTPLSRKGLDCIPFLSPPCRLGLSFVLILAHAVGNICTDQQENHQGN